MRIYSHSALKTWQRCPKKWSYKYIDRIEPADRPAHLERGSNIHALLESYHTYDMGFAHDLLTAHPDDADLIVRYSEKWEDEEWKVLHAEEEFHLQIGSYKMVFIPDLVIEIGDDIWIVDHKTTANIPDEWDPYNMSDFQHLLYVAGMQQIYGDRVKGFVFNYLRTKAPAQPKLVKDGSRIANVRAMDTDDNTLHEYAGTFGMLDHEEVVAKLSMLKHAPDRYFQRHYLPVSQSAVDAALADTAMVLKQMSNAEHGRPGGYPRHVVSKGAGYQSCGNCEYQPVCHNELLGIETDIELLGYIERPEREDT